MFLLDTNIISAIAPAKKADRSSLATWLDEASDHLFLTVVTVSEIAAGIAKTEREGATTKAALLRNWWQAVEHLYERGFFPSICAPHMSPGPSLIGQGRIGQGSKT